MLRFRVLIPLAHSLIFSTALTLFYYGNRYGINWLTVFAALWFISYGVAVALRQSWAGVVAERFLGISWVVIERQADGDDDDYQRVQYDDDYRHFPSAIEMQITPSHTRRVDIPKWIDPVKFTLLARGIADGVAFSEQEWTGSKKPFSRREFTDLRQWMDDKGLAQLKDTRYPQQGWIITPYGERAMKQWLTSAPLAREGYQPGDLGVYART